MVVLHYYKVVLGQLISQVKSNFYIRGLKVIAIKYLINTSYFSLENKLIWFTLGGLFGMPDLIGLDWIWSD